MLGKIKDIFGKKGGEASVNRRMANKLHDMPFKYVSEKAEDGTDTIIGRGGHVNIVGERGDELCATCGVKTIFHLKIDEMKIWEFMSLDGCVITFTDLDTGKERTVNMYYEKHLT